VELQKATLEQLTKNLQVAIEKASQEKQEAEEKLLLQEKEHSKKLIALETDSKVKADLERALREKIELAAAAEKLRLSQELETKEKAARDAALQAE
jgi:hypothetical protein